MSAHEVQIETHPALTPVRPLMVGDLIQSPALGFGLDQGLGEIVAGGNFDSRFYDTAAEPFTHDFTKDDVRVMAASNRPFGWLAAKVVKATDEHIREPLKQRIFTESEHIGDLAIAGAGFVFVGAMAEQAAPTQLHTALEVGGVIGAFAGGAIMAHAAVKHFATIHRYKRRLAEADPSSRQHRARNTRVLEDAEALLKPWAATK